ncbi:hypothetical protein QZH41_010239 [Actinostola sp. cb2023]|nr:hypothetical protein QZH41_010239 [Actinostola sp. cb2023]
MSSDEDDLNDSSQWISRPPSYRSETMKKFLQRLDKVHLKRSNKERRLAKKIKRTEGEAKEVEPPENTPLWAISQA